MAARLLSRGARGADVSELQAALNFHIRGPAVPLNPDGAFGALTDARVREFQRRAGLKDDGIVGQKTIAALYRTLFGIVEATLTPRESPRRQPAFAAPVPVGGGSGVFAGGPPGFGGNSRSALLGFPGLGQVIPDFVPPSQATTQARTAESSGFDVETKVLFSPLADQKDGEHPIKITISPTIPWPIFLTKPLKLELESGSPGVGQFQLDGKIKAPFELIESRRLELKPYFFVGAGVRQDHFKEVNAGAGTNVRLKLLNNIAGSGVSLGLEADGGGKYQWDKETGETKFKGYFEGGAVIEAHF